MAGGISSLPILTYHSISNEPGPTSIAPDDFAAQMAEIEAAQVDVIDLATAEKWVRGEHELTRRAVAITFDDAFRDFADAAFPVLKGMDFPATVFVPTSVVGGEENWLGANDNARPLLDWTAIRALSEEGVAFGSHSRRHCDLTKLSDAELNEELASSRAELETRLGKAAPHFAPPYGRSDQRVRSAISRHYTLSVGVRLDEARRDSPIDDLPRIEMFYYRDLNRWRAFLERRGGVYLQARKAARSMRNAVTGAMRRSAY